MIRKFGSQILTALKFLRQLGVIHCDLKPENVLLEHSSRSAVKVIDLGSACLRNEKVYTYIQSRFYRAPEIMLGIEYTSAIDMWSFGCMLVEFYTGYPPFPGESETDQMLSIMEYKGLPPSYLCEQATRADIFFQPDWQPRVAANSKGKRRVPGTKDLRSLIGDGIFADLVLSNFYTGCLEWDPLRRISPALAA